MSMATSVLPSISNRTSIASRRARDLARTITRGSPASVFTSVLLPAFLLPTIVGASGSARASGSAPKALHPASVQNRIEKLATHVVVHRRDHQRLRQTQLPTTCWQCSSHLAVHLVATTGPAAVFAPFFLSLLAFWPFGPFLSPSRPLPSLPSAAAWRSVRRGVIPAWASTANRIRSAPRSPRRSAFRYRRSASPGPIRPHFEPPLRRRTRQTCPCP